MSTAHLRVVALGAASFAAALAAEHLENHDFEALGYLV